MSRFDTCIEYSNPRGNSRPEGERRTIARYFADDARALRFAERQLDKWVARSSRLFVPQGGWNLKIVPIQGEK